MKNLKITFSDDSRDFSAWMCGKCEKLLSMLCETLKANPTMKDDSCFLASLEEALKVYALVNENLNGIYCDLVLELLIQYNVQGFNYLKNFIFRSKIGVEEYRDLQWTGNKEILALIEANDKSNRTKIAALLASNLPLEGWKKEIADDLEYVHNGERTWEWFYSIHYNDRNTYIDRFEDPFIKKVYDYFQSDEYKNADCI